MNISKPVGAAAEAPCAIQPAVPPTRNATTAAAAAIAVHERRGRAALPHHAVEREPVRHRLVGDRAVARADGFGLRPPGGDLRGLLGMRGEPGGDGLLAVGRQFAVDIGVQFVLGHG